MRVEEDDRFINEHWIRLLRAEDRDAAADVAGERLHVFERRHLRLAPTCGAREFFKVEFGVTGNYRENIIAAAGR